MPHTIIADISGNSFPPLAIPVGAFVVWRNLDPYPHTVETDPKATFYFNVGPLATGEVSSPVWFGKEGLFPYVCRFHAEMQASVAVGVPLPPAPAPSPAAGHMPGMPGMPGMGLQHFHGFVTGGRSAAKLYMTHTPVIADERHRYQVILRGHLVEPAHVKIYEDLRASSYGAGQVQTFHDHLSLVDIGAGKIVDLPQCNMEYYPKDSPDGTDVPGLDQNVPVHIDKVLHFHTIDPDADYPDGLRFLVYGDGEDVFMDHALIGAPSFHSVVKLKDVPKFWTPEHYDATLGVLIREKRIVDVSPKVLRRTAFVDNAYHLSWLPPSGAYRQPPPDPLIRRDGMLPKYDVDVDGGASESVEIDKFVHFDVALLNNRVVIL